MHRSPFMLNELILIICTQYACLLIQSQQPSKGFLSNLYSCQTVEKSRNSVCESHGWANTQHQGFFQPALELRHRQTQSGDLQHGLPGRRPDSPPAGVPHHPGSVLPLLLLSPRWQPVLLQRHDSKVRNKEEKELRKQQRRLVDLCKDGTDDA